MELGDIWRRFARNAAMIVGGRIGFGLLNLATNAVVVRVFGLEDLGVVLLLQAYARLFSEIVKFQSWQAVLRYGAGFEENAPGLRRLVGFTLGLDLLGFAVAIGAAILLVPWAVDWFGWSGDVADFAPFFVLSIAFITHATPTGVVRLFDRVDALAIQHALNSMLRFAGVCLAAALDGGVMHTVLAWFAASVLSGGYLIAVSVRLAFRCGVIPELSVNWLRVGREFPQIWQFLCFTNASTFVPLAVKQGSTIFVGAQLGAAAAATWEIARQFGGSIAKPVRLLGPLMFPELSRMAARDDWRSMRRLVVMQIIATLIGAGGIALVLLSALPVLIELIFGAELLSDVALFRLTVVASLIALAGFLLNPAFLSAGKAGILLVIQAGAVLVFAAIALLAMPVLGLVAIGHALLGFQLAQNGLLLLIGRTLIRKRIRLSRPAGSPGSAPG